MNLGHSSEKQIVKMATSALPFGTRTGPVLKLGPRLCPLADGAGIEK